MAGLLADGLQDHQFAGICRGECHVARIPADGHPIAIITQERRAGETASGTDDQHVAAGVGNTVVQCNEVVRIEIGQDQGLGLKIADEEDVFHAARLCDVVARERPRRPGHCHGVAGHIAGNGEAGNRRPERKRRQIVADRILQGRKQAGLKHDEMRDRKLVHIADGETGVGPSDIADQRPSVASRHLFLPGQASCILSNCSQTRPWRRPVDRDQSRRCGCDGRDPLERGQ